jgi:K+-transporting ATPase ATPase B chain
MRRAAGDAWRKLDPRWMFHNPVMFVVETCSFLTSADAVRYLVQERYASFAFVAQIALWLWLTVFFANFAEAVAEGRGKAQAAALRGTKAQTAAKLFVNGEVRSVPSTQLRVGDVVLVEAGDVVPGDGTVVEGAAMLDESAITGESAPVLRESGGDRNAVTGGTKVLSDWIRVQITANPGETFLDRMINLIESQSRRKTPNEIALEILLAGLTLIFVVVVATVEPFAIYSGRAVGLTMLVALLVCLAPTTIGALLSAIGISGMNRLLRRNVVALSGRAIEAAGDVNVIMLDKTGTLTLGNREAESFLPLPGASEAALAEAAFLSSLSDRTPEGRSVVSLARHRYGLSAQAYSLHGATFHPFSARTRMSGVDWQGRIIRKGAVDAVAEHLVAAGGPDPGDALRRMAADISRSGGTPLAVSENDRCLGLIHLKDIVKTGLKERIASLHTAGIKTVMITGDNQLTAQAIAAEVGVDDFLAEATPEKKLDYIQQEKARGNLVAMVGDGTNDAPAMASADVAVAMNTGTQSAREAGNMIDLDSNPTKLIDIVEVGKQILITRGALTTFSVANDVAKYFAILPAMFIPIYPGLSALNIMHLTSPQSAVLAAVIFNAAIIPALIPLSLRGVRYRPAGAAAILRYNLLLYGLGGVVLPFVGIKAIDLLITALGLPGLR